MKYVVPIVALTLIASASAFGIQQWQSYKQAEQEYTEPQAGIEADAQQLNAAIQKAFTPSYEGSSASGSYLSGRFAQRHHDWSTAGRYIDYVLKKHPENSILLKRAMVLAMGAGKYQQANEVAQSILDNHEDDNTLSILFLSAQAFKNKNYQAAADYIEQMPEGGFSSFIMPLLDSWSKAALGEYDVEGLKTNSIHLYHAILIAEFMDKKDAIKDMLKRSLGSGELGPEDLERIADIYAHIGEKQNALALYEQALVIDPDSPALQSKIEKIDKAEISEEFIKIQSAEDGVAEAFYDMARLLKQDYSDESSRVFGHVALYLNPQHTRARLLLAQIAARNERYNEAITLYKDIDEGDADFLKARRNAADILFEQGQSAESIQELKILANDYNDLDALIQIGNIYRIDEQFSQSIKAYNQAAEKIGTIGADHWHLHYVRGMSYEQNDQWDKAEADLQAALAFQPNHPYILNYLGYAWADQGKNLDQALQMIKKAVDIRPGDGYITDSLGWVYYRMGRYKEAVPYLELAVELMPYDPIINDHLGDAYWKVGRKLEAEFQWTRAKNHSEDDELILAIDQKLLVGLDEFQTAQDEPIEIENTDVDMAAQDEKTGQTEIQ